MANYTRARLYGDKLGRELDFFRLHEILGGRSHYPCLGGKRVDLALAGEARGLDCHDGDGVRAGNPYLVLIHTRYGDGHAGYAVPFARRYVRQNAKSAH